MKYQLRPYQLKALEELRKAGELPILCLPTGAGKCFAENTEILMYDGSVKFIQDVSANDKVMGWDSKPRTVLSTTSGKEMMYEIIPIKGESYTVNESHILSLKLTGNKSKSNGYSPGQVANLTVKDYLQTSKTFKHCAKGWRVAVEFETNNYLAIDPYFLGLWLGDGSSRGMTITTIDSEIINYLHQYAKINKYRIRVEPDNNHFQIHFLTDQQGRSGGSARKLLKHYNLILNKHIPLEYKTASAEDRLKLLAGLIDSDGSYSRGGYDWINKNKRLACDFAYVCRSLGLAAYVKKCNKSAHKNHIGTYYRVSVSGDCSIIPCKVERKKAEKRQQQKNVLLTGISVKPIGIGDYYGFTLVEDDRMFLLGDFTVVHNTVTFSHLAEAAIKKGNTVHVVCHRKELIDQARQTMKDYGIPLHMVKFGMVQTYVKSPHKIPQAALTIIDEAHCGNFRKFCEMVKGQTFIIGATATPISASKHQPLNQVFKSVVCPVQIPELIDGGYLSKPTYHIAGLDLSGLELASSGDYSERSQNEAFSNLFSIETLTQTMQQIGNEKTIIFTSSVEMAEKVSEMVTPSYLVHSKMTESERNRAINGFKHDPNGVIVNCSILTAGFDDPDIRHVVLYRATTSEPLYLQMVGRGSRITSSGFASFHVWDLGQNYKRIAYWHMDRDWAKKFFDQGKKIKKGESPYKNCISCEALISASARTCAICNEVQPAPKPKEQQTSHEFTVIEYGRNIPDHLRKAWSDMTVKELIERAQYGSANTGRPYKMGWILNQLRQRTTYHRDLTEFARLKGYQNGWVRRQIETASN